MKIDLHQTLHGYERGHQLLAKSRELTDDEESLLLYQSDLSGPVPATNFEKYITGYPIVKAGVYAFARTWYAKEMRRAGCVWTHTLLIKFADLGKIPELLSLDSFFVRPVAGEYKPYIKSLQLEIDSLGREEEPLVEGQPNAFLSLVGCMYNSPEKTILIPASNSLDLEPLIYSLWSWQWPRLRRNFHFCSGALSLKTLKDREFDLQVIPYAELSQIAASSNRSSIFDPLSLLDNKYEIVFTHFRRDDVRKFLWTFGADIPGERKYYFPLLNLYLLVNKEDVRIDEVVNELQDHFPDANVANNFKIKFLTNDKALNIKLDEVQMVDYLLEKRPGFIHLEELDFEERILDLFEHDRIGGDQLIKLITGIGLDKVSMSFWSKINLSAIDFIDLWIREIRLVPQFLSSQPELALRIAVWNSPINIQEAVYFALVNSKVNWEPYWKVMLEAQTPLILRAIQTNVNYSIQFTLTWLNEENSLTIARNTIFANIALNYRNQIFAWIHDNNTSLSSSIFLLILNNYDRSALAQIYIPADRWLYAYRNLMNEEHFNKVYISSFLLALGFNNSLKNSDSLVGEIFSDVYSFAANGQLHQNLWNSIPKDDLEDQDEVNFIGSLISFLGLNPAKKKYQISNWDYCEVLIRTLVTKFIRNYWPAQSFLNALSSEESFYRALEYLISFKKGGQFLMHLEREVLSKNVKAYDFQLNLIKRINSSPK